MLYLDKKEAKQRKNQKIRAETGEHAIKGGGGRWNFIEWEGKAFIWDIAEKISGK